MSKAGDLRPGARDSGAGVALAIAGMAWIVSQIVAGMIAVAVLVAGSWSMALPERPGGHVGRAVGLFVAGENGGARDGAKDAIVPIIVRLGLLVPGWLALIATVWVVFKVLNLTTRRDWRIGARPIDAPMGILAGLLLQVPVLVVVMAALQTLFGPLAPSGRALALVDQVAGPVDYLVLYGAIAIGAPLVEELFYRGVVQRNLVELFGPAVGVGLAAVIFGAVHFSWIEFLPLSVVGLVFGMLYQRSGRLAPAIAAHVTFNAFTLSFLLLSR